MPTPIFTSNAASVTRGPDGSRRTGQEIRDSLGEDWPSDQWVQSMVALAGADSVTIDPHKLGYIPYPAGAILLKDRRARELAAVDPPYLAPAGQAKGTEQEYLGRFIFEGSKPGAAAAAVWLSHKVLPLDESGYGFLIGRTVSPGQSISPSKQVMPSCFTSTSVSVRTSRIIHFDHIAIEVQIFCPLTM